LINPNDILQSLIYYIEGFVDDTSIFTNLDYSNKNIKELINKAQQEGQRWEGLLAASVCELELSKKFYYILIVGSGTRLATHTHKQYRNNMLK
jgi:hypothetical protein